MPNAEAFLTEFISGLEDASFSFNFATGGLGVLVYILQALALYTIAKRREIKKPWLAWIPVVNVWILGSISDQYQYVVKHQIKNKRKTLLGLSIATRAIVVFLVVFIIVGLFAGFLAMEPTLDQEMSLIGSNAFRDMVGVLLIVVLLTIPLTVLGVIYTVFFYMALYDLLRSCDPQNTTLYFVLGLVGNVVVEGAYSIFMILCKDKDLGMPPRKEEPEVIVEPARADDPWGDI